MHIAMYFHSRCASYANETSGEGKRRNERKKGGRKGIKKEIKK